MGLRRPGSWLALALIAAGLAQAGDGAWIMAKGALGQRLLDAAWARSRAAGVPTRPWPWADTWPVARLTVPRLGRSLVVLAGAHGEALAFGPGHVPGSARPGAAGNAVIAGHRDTHFDFLRELKPGDRLLLEDLRGRRTPYEVVDTAVADARHAVIRPGGEIPLLTLVACWPFDATAPGGPLRYLVFARRAGRDVAVAAPVPDGARSPPTPADGFAERLSPV